MEIIWKLYGNFLKIDILDCRKMPSQNLFEEFFLKNIKSIRVLPYTFYIFETTFKKKWKKSGKSGKSGFF